MHYVLDENGNPKKEDDIVIFSAWFASFSNRILKQDTIGEVKISTVFLGFNHNWGEGNPILWETMIFGGEHDMYQDRYSSKEDALKGHEEALCLVKNSLVKKLTTSSRKIQI